MIPQLYWKPWLLNPAPGPHACWRPGSKRRLPQRQSFERPWPDRFWLRKTMHTKVMGSNCKYQQGYSHYHGKKEVEPGRPAAAFQARKTFESSLRSKAQYLLEPDVHSCLGNIQKSAGVKRKLFIMSKLSWYICSATVSVTIALQIEMLSWQLLLAMKWLWTWYCWTSVWFSLRAILICYDQFAHHAKAYY